MFKYYFSILLCIAFYLGAKAQTTITSSYAVTTVTFSTGVTYITFAVRNNNPYAITLTDLSCLQANLYENNVYSLWYSPTSLSGAPTVTSPVWTLATTSTQPFTSGIITYVNPFKCIGVTIPAFTTYRFALQGSKGTAARGGATPNIFSSGGVDLLVGNNTSTGGQVGYFGWQNIGNSGTPYFFDGSITFGVSGSFNDIEVRSIIKPSSLCSSTSSTLQAQICNRSPQTINFGTTPANVTINVNGPIPQSSTIALAGNIAPCGCINATMGSVNMSAPGDYFLSATASFLLASDINPGNNTMLDTLVNYKPVVSPPIDSVCQFSSGPLFSGFDATGCQSRQRSITVSALLSPVPAIDGSSDATAGLFAQSSLPGLPAGAVITGGKLLITNLNGQTSGSFGNEARFSIYSPLFGVASPFVPGITGNPLNFSVYNFDYKVDITQTQMNQMYAMIGAGGIYSVGYWESVDNLFGASDVALNAQTYPTQVQLTVNYTLPAGVKWYTAPTGGSSISTTSPFNPFTTPGSGLTNSNVVGNYTFYAACLADTLCRVPVVLKINPSPAVVQDSLASCEILSGTGNGIFDLTQLDSNVSAFHLLASVSYYQDPNLTLLITSPAAYISNTSYVFSKVTVGSCYASDSVYLLVHQKPQFVTALMIGTACYPDYIDAALLIDPFGVIPAGSDTSYFSDPLFTIPHPNPHFVTGVDTVYMLLSTNTSPVCTDSAMALIQVQPASNFIVNQDTTFNFSIPGIINCISANLSDGVSDTIRTATDCARVVEIYDIPNGISLGNTLVCEEIAPMVPTHNGQPYVNRHYQISPTNNDSAMVCLYFLNDDFDQYNNTAFGFWPLLPTALNPSFASNLCVAKVSNGDLNTPGHTVVSIPNSSVTSTYDSVTTVWTVCFPVDSFSYFYVHAQNPLNIPLHVTLHSFTATKVHHQHLLQWQTNSEYQHNYVIVERSADGKLFHDISSPIPSKASNGFSQTLLQYAYTDASPFNGHNYYRLRFVDINGQIQYSQVIDLFADQETGIRLYPNPATDVLFAELQAIAPCNAVIQFRDATGRLVQKVLGSLNEGSNTLQINVADLHPGMYQVTVHLGKGLPYSTTLLKR
jgi:hypothetical protein